MALYLGNKPQKELIMQGCGFGGHLATILLYILLIIGTSDKRTQFILSENTFEVSNLRYVQTRT